MRGASAARLLDSPWAAFVVIAATLLVRYIVGRQCPDSLSPIERYTSSDLAIPPLMAMHFLADGEFPFFFWGQNWFGGLDALLHSVAFLVFGVSPWAMRMTLLTLYGCFCLLTYLVARDLFGRRAALFALLWCAFPPMFLTDLILIPSTSSLEAMVLGSLIIWLTIRLLSCRTAARRRFLYFLTGIFCGLGWWATPMITYYLAGCGAFVLFRERWRGVRLGLALTLPGFVLGALPFIVYYAGDRYSTIKGMGVGFHWSRLPFGSKRLFFEIFPSLFDGERYAAWLPGSEWAVAALYGYAAVAYLVVIGRRSSGEHARARPVIIWVFAALVAVYASSAHAERLLVHYVVVILSLAPVVLGYAVAESGRRFRYVAVPLFFALLVGQGALMWHWNVREVSACTSRSGNITRLIDRLHGEGLTRVYADYFSGSEELTFVAREKIIFANTMEERYRPYELALDGARDPAFLLDRPNALDAALRQTGGTARSFAEGGYQVAYGFEEPKRRYLRLAAGGIRVRTSHETDQAGNMLDGNMDSVWSSTQPKSADMWVQFDLGDTRSVGMVRLWNKGQDNGNYALDVSVEVSGDGLQWTTVIPRSQGNFYYWSGPRIYFWEWGYRMELRFGPVQARYIRIRQYENSDAYPWLIDEAYLYEDRGERAVEGRGDEQAQEALARRILALQLKNVYADRWISAKVREAGASRIQTVEPFTVGNPMFFFRFKDRVVQWGKLTGFVLDESDASSFEETLVAEGIEMSKEVYGRWALFFFERWGERAEELKGDPGWWWMGLGVVGTNYGPRSEYFKALGDKNLKQGQKEKASVYFEKARALRDKR